MATASDYLKYTNPINAPADPSRGFNDQIYINFTQGKKSLDEQLKEIDLANKQLALEQQKLMPVDAAAQEFSWSKAQADRAAEQAIFDRTIAQSEEARRAQEAIYSGQANQRANAATRQSRQEFKFNKQMSTEDLALKQSSEARAADTAALAAQVTQQDLAQSKALAPYQLQAAQESVRSTQLANEAAYAKAHPPAPPAAVGLQTYIPAYQSPNYKNQAQWAVASQGDPNYRPPGTMSKSPAPGLGTWRDPATGQIWYV